ncbi:GNAT family N-acetyltransferase [Paenibacillus ehimensis]|uniref:GNAT family N-acetyltransferase n=1 Tax=Paenibacillus ehimensis TaxID=79264 RepID=A0ABT8VG37_9BACL|nr:GNAT family N-acetyltransferase [Paenibacillus ehimensis]MDO3679953.1 GNAT family N-acetyltransferase [Paenibacillus ehimensis]MEC0212057.1 GNAT family N-acetyltransferase [Paenibacillus ehimensis]
MAGTKIVHVPSTDSDLASLIRQLDAYLAELYPPEEIFGLDFEDAKVDETCFVVAYSDDRPVGCGAIRPLNDKEVELKRFYVEPACRGNGTAKQLLAFLENKAHELSFEAVRLETGDRQPEAIRFYEKNGYAQIELYGEYVGCPSSLCYEKKLGASLG